MTYGADFRPGMNVLPRHDNVTLPPVAEYEAWIASLSNQGRSRATIPASRLRRACYLFATGTPLATAAKMLGLNPGSLYQRARTMPEALTGSALFRMLHGEAQA